MNSEGQRRGLEVGGAKATPLGEKLGVELFLAALILASQTSPKIGI